MQKQRNYLFVSGCDRSGTTALTRLLNSHRDISLGMERYKFLTNDKEKIKTLTKDRFQRKMFFDIKETETNIDWQYFYDSLKEKYDNSKYIGDKNPRYFQNYPHFEKNFPGAKHIFIIRDPIDVANSWKVRAEKDSDVNWLKSNNVTRSVLIWNRSLDSAMSAVSSLGLDMHFVSYERIFSGEESELQSMLEFLCVDNEITSVFKEMTKNWEQISTKKKILTEEEIRHVELNADISSAERLISFSSNGKVSFCNDATVTKHFGIFASGHSESMVRHKRIKDGRVDYVSNYLGRKPEYEVPKSSDSRSAFYGGIKFDHFGHFILESLARLSSYNGEDVIVWHGKDVRFRAWQLEILQKLGFGEVEHLVVKESVYFTKIGIAEPNCVIADKFTIRHARFLRSYSKSISTPANCKPRKIWISRAVGKNLFSWNNEMTLQGILALDGWEVVIPQDLSVSEQVELFSDRNIIAGVEGSAFHSVVFAKLSKCRMKLFTRKKEVNSNYPMIENIVGARHNYFHVPCDEKSNVNIFKVLTLLEFPLSKIPLDTMLSSYSLEERCGVSIEDVFSKFSVDQKAYISDYLRDIAIALEKVDIDIW